MVHTDDQLTFTVVPTEAQRVFALGLSNTPGAIILTLFYWFRAGADIGNNANLGVYKCDRDCGHQCTQGGICITYSG